MNVLVLGINTRLDAGLQEMQVWGGGGVGGPAGDAVCVCVCVCAAQMQ